MNINLIKFKIKELGFTQKEFSKQLGITDAGLRKMLLSGKFKSHTLLKMAKLLNTDTASLLSNDINILNEPAASYVTAKAASGNESIREKMLLIKSLTDSVLSELK